MAPPLCLLDEPVIPDEPIIPDEQHTFVVTINLKLQIDGKYVKITQEDDDEEEEESENWVNAYLLAIKSDDRSDCEQLYDTLSRLYHIEIPKLFPILEVDSSYLLLVKKPHGEDLKTFLADSNNISKLLLYKDGKAIRISALYRDLLRSFVEGIRSLKGTEYKPVIDEDSVYIIYEGIHCSKPYIQFTNFELRDGRSSEWSSLRECIVLINKHFEDQEQPNVQLGNFMACLKHVEEDMQTKLLEDPIFWSWEQRCLFMIILVDALKANPEFDIEHPQVRTAMDNWKETIEKNEILRNLKELTDQNDYSAHPLTTTTSLTMLSVHTNLNVRECIYFMGNALCHFYENKSIVKRRQVSLPIGDEKQLMELFDLLWPNHLTALYEASRDLDIGVGRS